ncbi:hypothetical protein [Rikenella microfusus]|uniref:hypothetical protein n=1 Tax=Rikenella microfusus TaxID=28139 RepID=UPI0023530E32|nr:hypothetical protein [Rikenella microfusus]
MEKALTKLQTEKAEMEAELEYVSKGILSLDDFMEYSLALRSNIFKMWNIVDLGDKRRLQNLIFPKGIVCDKETARIEPREVNRLFVTIPCESEQTVEKESGQTDKNINLSALAPRLGLEPRTP